MASCHPAAGTPGRPLVHAIIARGDWNKVLSIEDNHVSWGKSEYLQGLLVILTRWCLRLAVCFPHLTQNTPLLGSNFNTWSLRGTGKDLVGCATCGKEPGISGIDSVVSTWKPSGSSFHSWMWRCQKVTNVDWMTPLALVLAWLKRADVPSCSQEPTLPHCRMNSSVSGMDYKAFQSEAYVLECLIILISSKLQRLRETSMKKTSLPKPSPFATFACFVGFGHLQVCNLPTIFSFECALQGASASILKLP